jgi:hypothetical protein
MCLVCLICNERLCYDQLSDIDDDDNDESYLYWLEGWNYRGFHLCWKCQQPYLHDPWVAMVWRFARYKGDVPEDLVYPSCIRLP